MTDDGTEKAKKKVKEAIDETAKVRDKTDILRLVMLFRQQRMS